MTFTEHLAELRKRLAIALGAFLAAGLACFSFAEKLADFLMRPAGALKFVYLSPPELFLAYVKLSLIAGLAVSLPVILYEAWVFVSPALSRREKRSVFFALFFGAFFFVAGAAFAYYVIVPFTIKFFLSYANPRIEAVFAVKDYFDFITDLGLAFGASFELPMLATLLGAFGILKAELLVKFRRYAILGIVVAAAVLTPPDVVSQILLSLPMLGLYELSILILKVQGRARARRERLEAEAEAESEGAATEA